MAWNFLRKQGQLLGFAQALSGRQSVDPLQPARVGNRPGAGLGGGHSSVKACPSLRISPQGGAVVTTKALASTGTRASWNAIPISEDGSPLPRGGLTTPQSTRCSLES